MSAPASAADKGFTLYEINSRPWLYELRLKYGEETIKTIADVPKAELERLKEFGVDMVWLQDDDVIGSPYAITQYVVSDELGGDEAMQLFREQLAAFGMKLMLDLVPNHMAVDSVWMQDEDKKDYFLRRPTDGNHFNRAEFMEDGTAHGKDPYCGAWPDTAQLNYFNPAVREEMTSILIHLASICDGLRVDMAMLLINKIHEQCWGEVLKAGGWAMPETEFWTDAIKAMRAQYPDTVLMAEVYWGLDEELIRQGFNSTYDKAVYDIAQSKHLDNLRGYVGSKTPAFMAHSTHFIENHDEPRAVAEFGGKMQANCAAAVLFFLPGIRLQFHGQWSGCSRTLDVHLRRCAEEEVDEANERFYRRLNSVLAEEIFHKGEWKLCEVYDAGRGDRQPWRLVSYMWSFGDSEKRLFVANYSDEDAGGHIRLDNCMATEETDVEELMTEKKYQRNGQEIQSIGLFVWLHPWQMQVFKYT